MAKKKKNDEQKITRPIAVIFTERTLKAVVNAINTTKMCYGDSILADTRVVDIILTALASGQRKHPD